MLALHYPLIQYHLHNPKQISVYRIQLQCTCHNEITLQSIKHMCRVINLKTASGIDRIPPHFCHHASDNLFIYLHWLFNNSLRYGIVPPQWKRAIVCAIYKDDDKSYSKSYRPISITPVIIRLFERLLYLNIYHQLAAHLHQQQQGFRRGHGCHYNLFCIQMIIDQSIHRYNTSSIQSLVFLDIQKAFDTCDHDT